MTSIVCGEVIASIGSLVLNDVTIGTSTGHRTARTGFLVLLWDRLKQFRGLILGFNETYWYFLGVVQTCDPFIVCRRHHVLVVALLVAQDDLLLLLRCCGGRLLLLGLRGVCGGIEHHFYMLN